MMKVPGFGAILTVRSAREAECMGLSVKVREGKSPICEMARKLVAEGVAPETRITVMHGATVSFAAAPVAFWAGLSVSNEKNAGLRIIKYKPRPEMGEDE
jgi:hypothetical protein